MAHSLGSALAGLKKSGKAISSMTIEPMKPGTAVADLTKPTPHSESLVPPKKAGMPTMSISPSPKAGPGWKAQNAPAKPGAVARPAKSNLIKA
jgi:hypothetical protein